MKGMNMGKVMGCVGLLLCLVAVASGMVGGGEVTYEVKGAGIVVFSHENHVAGLGLSCTDCHAHLFLTKGKRTHVTMAQMRKGKSCGACHNGKRAFDVKGNCGNCHKK